MDGQFWIGLGSVTLMIIPTDLVRFQFSTPVYVHASYRKVVDGFLCNPNQLFQKGYSSSWPV